MPKGNMRTLGARNAEKAARDASAQDADRSRTQKAKERREAAVMGMFPKSKYGADGALVPTKAEYGRDPIDKLKPVLRHMRHPARGM